MPELLIELFSEEIPARMQAKAAADLRRLVTDGLREAGLEWEGADAFSGPRRLTLVVDGLPEMTPDKVKEKKGPAVGAPTQAIEGFLKSNGLDSVDICAVRDVKGKPTFFLVNRIEGIKTARALSTILDNAINAMPWPKSMRWKDTEVKWVRPLQNILALFNGEEVELEYGLIRTTDAVEMPTKDNTLFANSYTHGHRFLSPEAIHISDFADYRQKLTAAHVMLSAEDRLLEIEKQAIELCQAEDLVLAEDAGLLAEVTGLVEWPVVLMGSIDEAFMELPAEVLSATMKLHQKFFSVLNTDGTPAAKFIVVSNQLAPDGGAAIIAGNERVLRARLADAQFFWDKDRAQPLGSYAPKLKDIVFHAKLGTLDDKIDRVEALAAELCQFIPGADKDMARSAARLAKCDLVTGMVGELPELQGVMGGYYALEDGEKPAVADAIRNHYAPQGPGDKCPTSPVTVAAALSDKLDTLVGFWTIDEKPTGSKDPFALRRAALGVIRLIIENGLRLNLVTAIKAAGGEKIAGDLLSFFAERLKVHLKGEGVRHDLIDAVMAKGNEDDLVRLLARVTALSGFLGSDDGQNLLAAHKRAANILRIEEKKDKASYRGEPDANLFEFDDEKALFSALADMIRNCEPLLNAEKYEDAMSHFAKLRSPVDAFFDQVTVNAEDAKVRENRLKLLSQIQAAMDAVADFSKIEG